jgi:phage terminase small subunit
MSLTARQERFTQEYLIDLNAGAAYKRAGYTVASDDTAWVNGSRMLSNAKVAARISELQAARSHRTNITADRVLCEIARIAFASIADVASFDAADGVVFLDSTELDDDVKAAIAEISSDVTHRTTTSNTPDRTVKTRLKMHDKMAALKLLMQHLGLLSNFNCAIATLKKYGLEMRQTDATPSGWEVVLPDSPTV